MRPYSGALSPARYIFFWKFMRINIAISVFLLMCIAQAGASEYTKHQASCAIVHNKEELEKTLAGAQNNSLIYVTADWALSAAGANDAYVPSISFKRIVGSTDCVIADVTISGGKEILEKYSAEGIPFFSLVAPSGATIATLSGPKQFSEFKEWFESTKKGSSQQTTLDTQVTLQGELINRLKKLAEDGNREAQFKLGVIGLGGAVDSVDVDIDESMHWLTQASNKGCAGATGMLGLIYLSDDYGKKDDGKGIQLIKDAAELGDIGAQNALSALYYAGHRPLERDLELAYSWGYLSQLQIETLNAPLLGITIKNQLSKIEPALTKKQLMRAKSWVKKKLRAQGAVMTSICSQSLPILSEKH